MKRGIATSHVSVVVRTVPPTGFEPATPGLGVRRSSTELRGQASSLPGEPAMTTADDQPSPIPAARQAAVAALRDLADLAFHEGDVVTAKAALDAIELLSPGR